MGHVGSYWKPVEISSCKANRIKHREIDVARLLVAVFDSRIVRLASWTLVLDFI